MAVNGLRSMPQATAPKSPTFLADLAEVIRPWQSLSPKTRAEFLKLIRSHNDLSEGGHAGD
jgi:hypothetical protein